jgi:hypothetical protein
LTTPNRHPVDELFDTRAEIRRLREREDELRAYLLEHPDDREGDEHVATLGEQRRKHVDLRALADEIGASLLGRFTHYINVAIVKLRERERMEGRAGIARDDPPPVSNPTCGVNQR